MLTEGQRGRGGHKVVQRGSVTECIWQGGKGWDAGREGMRAGWQGGRVEEEAEGKRVARGGKKKKRGTP